MWKLYPYGWPDGKMQHLDFEVCKLSASDINKGNKENGIMFIKSRLFRFRHPKQGTHTDRFHA